MFKKQIQKITVDDVIKHLKDYDDKALAKLVEAVKLYREAEIKKLEALEIKSEKLIEEFNEFESEELKYAKN